MSIRRLILTGLALVMLSTMGASATTSEPVTLANLFRSESDWPYQVALTRSWRPEGHSGEFGWGPGTLGVLLRIDEGNRLRIDFGRFGVYDVPAEATDVVERANRLRSGEATKLGPNLTAALNRRLLDPSGKTLAAYAEDLFVVPKRLYVVVFADPAEPTFTELARASVDWAKQPDVLVVLVAQGKRVDAHVYKYCYDAGWAGVFLMDRFTEAYSADYLDSTKSTPNVQVMTPEGRLLFASKWKHGLSKPVLRAMQEAIGR